MSKNRTPAACTLLAFSLFMFLTGCATPYHDYADCCIPYRYCTPTPLPHTFYEGCHCQTPVGAQYADAQNSTAIEPAMAPPNGR
jgi:hypothetical protein